MSASTQFSIDALHSAGKTIHRLSVQVDESDDLIGSTYLAAKDTLPLHRIRQEVDKHFQDNTLSMPVLAARGAAAGKTLVVTAGVHGDEYEGMEAIFRIFETLDPSRMNGTFIAVPVVTLPAFWVGCRVNPLDRKNMARVFPGSPDGTASQRLAHNLLHRVLRHADFYIDLHSSGRNYHMMTLVGYTTVGNQSMVARQGADLFGAPVIWEHHGVSAGRTLSSTLELGIPSLYTEARGSGQVTPEDLNCYTRGLANLLEFLEIEKLPQAGPPPQPSRRLYGLGDLDFALDCSQGGLFFPSIPLGAEVARGDRLGIIRDLEGKVVEVPRSPQDGVVILIRATPRIFAGETVAALAETDPPDQGS